MSSANLYTHAPAQLLMAESATINSPVISSITDPVQPGSVVTISGSDLGEVNQVTLGGEEQTIDSQSETEITFTAALGGLKYGSQVVKVRNIAGEDSQSVTFDPVDGNDYVLIDNYPPPDGQISIFDDIDADQFSNGIHQCEYETTTDAGGAVTLNQDGTFLIEATGTHRFDARIWDAGDKTWGAWGTIEVNV